MTKDLFSRYEVKYLITISQYKALVEAIRPYTKFDSFGQEDGKYNIVSLYFDSPDKKIYYETRNKLRFRQKLRLRIYNETSRKGAAYLEIKQKYKNVVNKRRTKIMLQDAYDFLTGAPGMKPSNVYNASNPQILTETKSFIDLYDLRPNMVVSYDRQAFQGIYERDLRITFDYNLRCRDEDLFIENGPEGYLFVDPHLVILEVKVSHSVPFWLSRLLSEYGCARKSVSKFCTSIDLLDGIRDKQAIAYPLSM